MQRSVLLVLLVAVTASLWLVRGPLTHAIAADGSGVGELWEQFPLEDDATPTPTPAPGRERAGAKPAAGAGDEASSPVLPIGLGVAALVVVAGGWLALRRRKAGRAGTAGRSGAATAALDPLEQRWQEARSRSAARREALRREKAATTSAER